MMDTAATQNATNADGAHIKEAASCRPSPSRLWLCVVAAFGVQIGAWIIWFTIAAQHRVQEVPLQTRPARTDSAR
jgi:hypothetical protein